MNTSKFYSLVVLILLLSLAKVPAQGQDAFEKMFQGYGFEYQGVDVKTVDGIDVVSLNFSDGKESKIVLCLSDKPFFDATAVDAKLLNTSLDKGVLHYKTFKLKGQDNEIVALATKVEDSSSLVKWRIGFLRLPSEDSSVYLLFSGEGEKEKEMKVYKDLVAGLMGEAISEDDD